MLQLVDFDWEYAEFLSIAFEAVEGELVVEISGAHSSRGDEVSLQLLFRDVAFVRMIRDSAIDKPPTRILEFVEDEGITSPALEVGGQAEFIQINFKNGWSRATPEAGTFSQYNTYRLAAGALRLEWVSASLTITAS